MKINELSIEGFRGFKDEVKFTLDPQVNVFLGVNGAGKTTVLDALAVVLDDFVDHLANQSNSFRQLVISLEDFNLSGNTIINLKNSFIINDFVINYNHQFHLSKDKITDYSGINGSYLDFDSFRNNFRTQPSLPIFLYFNNHLNTYEFEAKTIMKDELIGELFEGAFSPNKESFGKFYSWFFNETTAENQIKINNNDFNYINPYLGIFRNLIEEFLEKIDDSINKYNIYIEYLRDEKKRLFLKKDPVGEIFIQKGKEQFSFNKLSEGEKKILLVLAEIIKKAIFASRFSINIEVIRNVSGIIMIDEIEQHLHPKWQRNIIPALTKVFPNIQWFFSTHSPQVLSNLKRENIHLIEDFKVVENVAPTYGEDTNSILWNIFGVGKRPLHAEKAFSKFYRMLEEDKDKSLEILNDLESTYGAEHSDVKKAKMEFELEFGN